MSIKNRESIKAQLFGESVIRGMTRLCREYDGVNLSQGFPDFPAPELIKEVAAVMMGCDDNYYFDLANFYQHKRDYLLEVLTAAGFRCQIPLGAYYIMADFRNLSELGDLDFAHYLVKEKGFYDL